MARSQMASLCTSGLKLYISVLAALEVAGIIIIILFLLIIISTHLKELVHNMLFA